MSLRIYIVLTIWSLIISYGYTQTIDPAILYLESELTTKGIPQSDLSDIVITGANTGRISKVRHTYFQQRKDGIPIYGAVASTHILPSGELLKLHNQFVSSLSEVIPNTVVPSISAVKAIEQAALALGQPIIEPITEKYLSNKPSRRSSYSSGGLSNRDIQASLVYYPIEGNTYRLAWSLVMRIGLSDFGGNIFIDAENGNELDRISWINSCVEHECAREHEERDESTLNSAKSHTPMILSGNTYSVCKTDDRRSTIDNRPQLLSGDTYNVYPMPIEAPHFGDRQMVMDPADAIASPYGWHDYDGIPGADTTITAGNNVSALESGNNPGFQPDGGGSLIFNFPIDTIYQHGVSESEAAIITNLFYWNNICHDVWYQYGFDEASGNFQENNYGNGGEGDDGVYAFAQINQVCNAFFWTPLDSTNPEMLIYTCGTRDVAIDNGVVAHEYGHGISNRLTGGPNQWCLNNIEQMGEGWSDWIGLMMTMDSLDQGAEARSSGTWILGQNPSGPGGRAYPYSTDLNINPHTYDSIRTSGTPHGLGTVWCVMLWEMTWALIDQYGFDPDFYYGNGGNNMAMALVIEALKLQPCTPGFVDGRDAILQADLALYGGANACLIWDAFAKRGLGDGADQGSSTNIHDGTESYYPSRFCVDPYVSFNSKGTEIIETATLQDTGNCKMYNEYMIPVYLSRDATDTTIVRVFLDNSSTIHSSEVLLVDSILIFTQPWDTSVRVRIYDDEAVESTELIVFGLQILNPDSTNATVQRDTLYCISIEDDERIPGDLTQPCAIDADFESSNFGFTTFSTGTDKFERDTEFGGSSSEFVIPESGSDTIYYINDDRCNCNLSDASLITPSIDLSDFDNPELTFDVFFEKNTFDGITELADVLISLNNGVNYSNLKSLNGSLDWRTDTISLLPYVGESNVKFAFQYSDAGGWLYGMALDNIRVCEKIPGNPAIAVDSGSVDEQYIAPYTDNYFYDNSGKIIARLQNGGTDLGCTQILIDRTGGFTNFLWDNTIGHKILSKTYYIQPENNDPNADYEITFYLNQAEVIEWENSTGNLFVNAKILKNPLPISTITPDDPEPAGPGSIEIGVDTFGNPLFEPTGYFIKAAFSSGFSGFAIGNPGSAPSDCPNNKTVPFSPVPNGTYRAKIELSSTGSIPPGGNVKFTSGKELLLLPNFEVKSGASFEASIEDCP